LGKSDELQMENGQQQTSSFSGCKDSFLKAKNLNFLNPKLPMKEGHPPDEKCPYSFLPQGGFQPLFTLQ